MEGRNRETLLEILQYLKETNQVKFSVEVEKVNRGFEDFIPYANLVFVSKVRLYLIYFQCSRMDINDEHNRPTFSVFKA